MELILENFSNCAKYYDKHATLQEQIAYDLARTIPNERKKILELGCGTGQLTKHLLHKTANLLITDGATNMLQICKNNFPTHHKHLLLDFNNENKLRNLLLSYKPTTVVASMSLQWANNLAAIINIIKNNVKDFYISIPLDNSLKDWYNLLNKYNITINKNVLRKQQYIENLLPEANIIVKSYQQEFLNVKAFLKHIHKMGIKDKQGAISNIPVNIFRKIISDEKPFILNYEIAHIGFSK